MYGLIRIMDYGSVFIINWPDFQVKLQRLVAARKPVILHNQKIWGEGADGGTAQFSNSTDDYY